MSLPGLSRADRSQFRAILFDMDGTLFSSEDILYPAYASAIRKYNTTAEKQVSVPSLRAILDEVGKPASEIFRNLFPELSVEERRALNTLSLENLCDSIRRGGGRIYEGIIPLLADLTDRRVKLFLVSNGRRRYIEAVFDGHRLGSYFAPLVTIEDPGVGSKADIIKDCIQKMNIPASAVLMVGDRKSDIEASREAGCPFAGALWGHGYPDEIEGADILLSNPSDLYSICFHQ